MFVCSGSFSCLVCDVFLSSCFTICIPGLSISRLPDVCLSLFCFVREDELLLFRSTITPSPRTPVLVILIVLCRATLVIVLTLLLSRAGSYLRYCLTLPPIV